MAPLLASDFDRGKFLKAGDLTTEKRFKIKSATVEVLGQDKDRKLVLWFTNDERGLVLNKTNIRLLTPVLGDDTRNWAGAIISVYPTTTSLGAKTVPCLRVKPPKVSVANPVVEPEPEPEAPKSLKDDLDDELPDDL
jgi:hypothetical protein